MVGILIVIGGVILLFNVNIVELCILFICDMCCVKNNCFCFFIDFLGFCFKGERKFVVFMVCYNFEFYFVVF